MVRVGGYGLRLSKFQPVAAADQGWVWPPLREGTPHLHREHRLAELLTETADIPTASLDTLKRLPELETGPCRPRIDKAVKRDLLLLTSPALEEGTHFQFKEIGPGHFILRDATTKAAFKVTFFGGDRCCSCGSQRVDRPCVHLLFVLLQVLGVPLSEVLAFDYPLSASQADRILERFQGVMLPYKSGIQEWKRPVDLVALQRKYGLRQWTLKDELAAAEYTPPRQEWRSTVQALCRVPAVFESCGGMAVVDDPSRPFSTLPVTFFPKGAVLPSTPLVDVGLVEGLRTPPLREVLVLREIKLSKGTEADPSFPSSAAQLQSDLQLQPPAKAYPYYDNDNSVVVAPGARVEPGLKIRSPAFLNPEKFKSDLKDFLMIWDMTPEGKPKQDLADSLHQLWISLKAFKGWLRVAYQANCERRERLARTKIELVVHLPNGIATGVRVCPLIFGWDLKRIISAKRQAARMTRGRLRKLLLLHEGREIDDQATLSSHHVSARATLFLSEYPLPVR